MRPYTSHDPFVTSIKSRLVINIFLVVVTLFVVIGVLLWKSTVKLFSEYFVLIDFPFPYLVLIEPVSLLILVFHLLLPLLTPDLSVSI